MIDQADQTLAEIFDCLSPAATDVAGREDEINWLTQQLGEAARVVLSGPAGMGKSTIVRQALIQTAERHDAVALRLDLDRYATFGAALDTLSQSVAAFAANPGALNPNSKMLGESRASIIGDSFSKSEKAPFATAREPNSTGLSFEEARRLGQSLDQFTRAAGSRNLRAVFVLESSQRLRELGGASALTALDRSMADQSRLAFVFCSQQTFLEAARRDFSIGENSGGQSRALDRVNPVSLARWINEKFALAGVLADGVGEICTQLGGPRTADVIELAKATLETAATVGRATVATVQKVMNRFAQRDAANSASQWAALTRDEQRFVADVVQQSRKEPVSMATLLDRFSVGQAEQHGVEFSLLKKGVLEKLPSGQLFVRSATFAYWSAEHVQRVRGMSFVPVQSQTNASANQVNSPSTAARRSNLSSV
ncbi:MAG TPA: ATP-binding protein [Opitutaceae bacterium]|nr:ATP-binding protein [Opitutaceae bacterium]